MRLFIHTLALGLALAAITPAAAHQAPSPEQVLTDAAGYTVKVRVQNEIAFNQDEAGSASGTGFLIDRKRGWVLTNAHVATRSPSVIKVSFKGGQQIEAKRIHVDPVIDLAVLSIPSQAIPAAATEASLDCDKLPVTGTSVLAYGHPWGLSFTASRGIVSGMSWFFPSHMIQTDAVVNSGNSGGPLISLLNGRVIGINTSTYKQDDKEENATAVSLAEPMPAICRIVDLLKAGDDTRLRLPPFAIATSGDDLRPLVAELFSGGSGFQIGDIVIRVNRGPVITTYPDLLSQLRGLKDTATFSVERDGKSVDVKAPLRVVADPLRVRNINLSGLVISEPWRLDNIEVNPSHHLVVDWYESGEEAASTDVLISDFIVSVDGREFSSINTLYGYLDGLASDANVSLILKRASSAPEFHREFRHIILSRRKLEWVAVQ